MMPVKLPIGSNTDISRTRSFSNASEVAMLDRVPKQLLATRRSALGLAFSDRAGMSASAGENAVEAQARRVSEALNIADGAAKQTISEGRNTMKRNKRGTHRRRLSLENADGSFRERRWCAGCLPDAEARRCQ